MNTSFWERLVPRVAFKAMTPLAAIFLSITIPALPIGAQAAAKPAAAPSRSGKPIHYAPDRMSKKAESYYEMLWGLDSLKVSSVESGALIRFRYRVVDAEKARLINDDAQEPSLIAPRAGVRLVVPSLEKVGKLRQVSTPQAGKMYWMAFSNKGGFVKPGDRVDIVIGNFHANGLVVE